MTIGWFELGAEGQVLAAEHFLAGSMAAALRERDHPHFRPRFADLYAWVTDPAFQLSAEQEEWIEQDPALRRTLALLVGRVGQLRAAAAAAASSGGLQVRRGDGFTVRLTPSRADAAQIYVSIEIDPDTSAAPPGLLLVLRDEFLVGRLALPEAADGIIQVIDRTDSAAVRGLRAAETELVLV